MTFIFNVEDLTPRQRELFEAVKICEVDSVTFVGSDFRVGTAKALAARGFIHLDLNINTGHWVARMLTDEERMISTLRDRNGTRIEIDSIVAYRSGVGAFMIGSVNAIYADPEQGEVQLEIFNRDGRMSYQGWYVFADAVTVISLPELEN